MKLRNKTIRVFLSSTFEDLKMERDALQRKAFKNLREYCRERGWQFQAVDLRWGINNEATIDQRTMEICLREIARCQEQSPRPNFIVLLGERYGWRPLPDRVLQSVALKMAKEIPPEIQSLFRQWYELDENQLPEPVWKLRAREGRYIDYNEYEKTIQKPLAAFFTRWAAENLPDPELPENKRNPLALQRLSMERSATEQEIQVGAFGVEDAREHVFAFFRNLSGCPEENITYRDPEQNPVQRLRTHLKSYLHEDNVSEFSTGWDKEKKQPDTAHLEKLSHDVENCLKAIIDREIENYQLTNEHELEQAAHEVFSKERTFGFSGRENDIAAICEYTTQNQSTPFVVWGESGTGKSTLMAMAARRVQETLPHAHVITRFIGVTGKSANGHTLLAGICRNICLLYGGEPAEIPEDPAKLQYAFRQYLAKATEEHPLVLFLDALDQFNEGDAARLLQWLPELFPPHMKLITSTLKGVSFDVLKQRNEPAPVFYEITPLMPADGRNALAAWLKRANRTLQSHQAEQIIRDFEYAGCTPLYLHLAFEQAQHWESFARRQRLGRDIPEMIEEFYDNLSRPEAHGSIVDKALTAIRCAKQGLSDDEILGVLAADDEFWNSFGIQTYHTYDDGEKTTTASRLIPPVLWIRLYHDLEYYLTRRNAPGGEVITFYHRQLAEAVDNIYLQRTGMRQKRHKELADFFAGKRLLIKETAPLIANIRVCDELPWLLIHSEDWDAVTDTLCNLDFIQAKAAAGMTYELVDDYNEVLRIIPENDENSRQKMERKKMMKKYTQDLLLSAKGRITTLNHPESIIPWVEGKISSEIERIRRYPSRVDRLNDFLNFLGTESQILHTYASELQELTIQQAWNRCKDGPVGTAASFSEKQVQNPLMLKTEFSRPLFNPHPLKLKSFSGHTDKINDITITPDGKYAISCSEDETCIFWNVDNTKPLKILDGYKSKKIKISFDAKKAILVFEKKLVLWEIEKGIVTEILTSHSGSINDISLSIDGRRAISCSADKTCILWDLETKTQLMILKGHLDNISSVVMTPDGKYALSTTNAGDGTIILWDLTNGKEIKKISGLGQGWSTLCSDISQDGGKAILGGADNNFTACKLVDLNSGSILKSLIFSESVGSGAWKNWISSVKMTADCKLAVTSQWNKDCLLWDLDTCKVLKKMSGHKDEVNAISITPNGEKAISASSDSTCILWDLEKGFDLGTMTNYHSDGITSVQISPDGKKVLAFSTFDKKCTLWNEKDINQTRIVCTDYDNRSDSYAFSPNGKHACIILNESECGLFDPESFTINKMLRLDSGLTDFNTFSFSADSMHVLTGHNWDSNYACEEDCNLRLWNIESAMVVHKFEQSSVLNITSINLSPSGNLFFTDTRDTEFQLWDLSSKKLIHSYEKTDEGDIYNYQWGPYKNVQFLPDGKLAAVRTTKGIEIFNPLTEEIFRILHIVNNPIVSYTICPTGRRVITGHEDKTLVIWNLLTGNQITRLVDCSDLIEDVRFSSNGKYAVTISNKTCYLWDIEIGKNIAQYISEEDLSSFSLHGSTLAIGRVMDVIFINFLKNNINQEDNVLTIRQIFNITSSTYSEPIATCPICGKNFTPPNSVLITITELVMKADLKSEQSPCLELPNKAWEHPALLSECPQCHEKLKFNPFIAGGE